MALSNVERKLRYRKTAKHREVDAKGRDTPRGRANSLVKMARQRARLFKVPFSLKISDVLWQLELGVCAVTGIAFESGRGRGTGNPHPFTPSLDRIEPKKGYTPDNVQVVIWAYNAMRGTWGDEVLRQVAVRLLIAS